MFNDPNKRSLVRSFSYRTRFALYACCTVYSLGKFQTLHTHFSPRTFYTHLTLYTPHTLHPLQILHASHFLQAPCTLHVPRIHILAHSTHLATLLTLTDSCLLSQTQETDTETETDLQVHCITCGLPLAPKVALRHMEKCYMKVKAVFFSVW